MSTSKELLRQYNQKKYHDFLLNDKEELALLAPSSMLGIAVSSKRDVFIKKTISGPDNEADHCVTFIKKLHVPRTLDHDKITEKMKKKAKPHTFIWRTSAQKIKEAVRWGIIKETGSLSSRVIGALGQYRVTAHQRVFKGMISSTQSLKIKLLDLYQTRFELLEPLESLVNKDNSQSDYKKVIKKYIKHLEKLSSGLNEQFTEDEIKINPKMIQHLKGDIADDCKRARSYLQSVLNNPEDKPLREYNRSRGHSSILELVKQQILHNLYEFQGINQDITYSRNRRFALTRGGPKEFNDSIIDGLKVIADYGSDPRNSITPAHHGVFAENPDTIVTYDFCKEDHSPQREQEILLAISFTEGWDKVERDGNKFLVKSGDKQENLSTIYATNWRKHRDIKAFFKNLGHYVLNILKGILLPTRPWREEAWKNKDFHLHACQLMAHTKFREPLWLKPFKLLKGIGQAIVDIFKGVGDFGKNLIVRMPADLFNDWASTNKLVALTDVLKTVGEEIDQISKADDEKLNQLFLKSNYKDQVKEDNHLIIDEKDDVSNNEIKAVDLNKGEFEQEDGEQINFEEPQVFNQNKPVLAQIPYKLHFGEQNDILNAVVRGVEGFSDVFTHNIYAKDPVAGLLFTAAYCAGGAMIFFPAFCTKIIGTSIVNGFSSFSYAMGSSSLEATIAGGSTLAQICSSTWDLLIHGPSSITANALSDMLEDPVTAGSALIACYGLGFGLTKIPGFGPILKEGFGTRPEIGCTLTGAKLAVSCYEALIPGHMEGYKQVSLSYNGKKLDEIEFKNAQELFQDTVDRIILAHWLNQHSSILPKLKRASQAAIVRQIEHIFSSEEADSLKKLIYPEKSPSIAFQLFAIPLGYIPAVLRLILAVVLSLVAWGMEPHPWEPIKRAGSALGKKIRTDLNRLLILQNNIVNFAFKMLAVFIKMVAYILNMLIGRLAGLIFGQQTGHATHRMFAAVHGFFRTVGEFFYPARAAKSVVIAHPAHVVQTTQTSYQKMLTSMKVHTNQEGTQLSDKENVINFTDLKKDNKSMEIIQIDSSLVNPSNDDDVNNLKISELN